MGRLRISFLSLLLFFLSLPPVTGQLNQEDMASSLEEALTFTKYPTYGQYVDMMQKFATDFPSICRLDTIGTSRQGRLVLALKISDHPDSDEPEARFLYTSTMHGDELTGFPLMLRLIDHLLKGYGTDAEATGLVDSLEIWINPLSNPDGTFAGGDSTVAGSIRGLADVNHTDMNRDFPDISQGETDTLAGRQKETADMMRFLREKRFSLSANLHGGFEVVNYPWDYTKDRHPDSTWFKLISLEYADEAHSVDPYYMAYNGGATPGADWYYAYGTRQDYVTYFLQGREVTLELSFDKQPESDSLESFWQKNRRSFLYYMTQATYGIRGTVRSAATGEPVRARVRIDGHDDEHSMVWSRGSTGNFYRLIKAGTYEVTFSAEGYHDLALAQVEVEDFGQTWLYPLLEADKSSVAKDRSVFPFRIWPNPADGVLHLEWSGTATGSFSGGTRPVLAWIHSADGRLIRQVALPRGTTCADLSLDGVPPGFYFLRVDSGEGIYTTPFIRE